MLINTIWPKWKEKKTQSESAFLILRMGYIIITHTLNHIQTHRNRQTHTETHTDTIRQKQRVRQRERERSRVLVLGIIATSYLVAATLCNR